MVFDNEQEVEQLECCRHDDAEVTGQYGLRMVANNGGPALFAAGLSVRAFGHALAHVRGDTRILSLSNSSLAMRSSPHVGFLKAISRMSAPSSGGIGGRPGRDFQRQKRRKP
jgi:hypothetical protein